MLSCSYRHLPTCIAHLFQPLVGNLLQGKNSGFQILWLHFYWQISTRTFYWDKNPTRWYKNCPWQLSEPKRTISWREGSLECTHTSECLHHLKTLLLWPFARLAEHPVPETTKEHTVLGISLRQITHVGVSHWWNMCCNNNSIQPHISAVTYGSKIGGRQRKELQLVYQWLLCTQLDIYCSIKFLKIRDQ